MFESHHFERLLEEFQVLRHDLHHLRTLYMSSIADLTTLIGTLQADIAKLPALISATTGTGTGAQTFTITSPPSILASIAPTPQTVGVSKIGRAHV